MSWPISFLCLPEDILDDTLEQISRRYATFDKNKYRRQRTVPYIGIEQPTDDTNHGDLAKWVWAAYLFLLNVIREELGIKIDAVLLYNDTQTIHSLTSKGFQSRAATILELPSRISKSTNTCQEVLNGINNFRDSEYMLPFMLDEGAFSQAIENLDLLVTTMKVLEYAKILDQQLVVRRLVHAYTDVVRRQPAVDHAQSLLDATENNTTAFPNKQRKNLERLLYNAARNDSILPLQFFIKNVQQVGDHPIGGGGYGDVYEGRAGRQYVAVKVPRRMDSDKKAELLRKICKEAVIWKTLKHDYVLPFLGLCTKLFNSTGLVSPFMTNGHLLAYLKGHLDIDKQSIMEKVCRGLDYLHRHDPEVIHGDVKCANILVDDNGDPQLADFGLARMLDIATQTNTSYSVKGTLRWAAPELVLPGEYGGDGRINASTDIYSFGMTCLELFTEKSPFDNLTDGEVVLMARDGTALERALVIAEGSWVSRILQHCCSADPQVRSKASEVLSEFFFSTSPSFSCPPYSEGEKGIASLL